MSPALWVLAAWLLFGGSHLLLSSSPLRAALARKFGDNGFVVGYTAIATITLTLLIVAVWRYGADGSPGPDLAAAPAGQWILGAIALAGAILMVGGLLNYGRSPMAELARRRRASNDSSPKPLDRPAVFARVTRHPFFVGLALLMGAHALLAGTLAGTVYFAGFAVLSLIGMPLQDRKLRKRHGELYRDYLRQSSVVPFAATRRSASSDRTRAWPAVLAAIAGAVFLTLLHPLWRLGHGAPFAALVLIGGLYAVARQLRRRE